MFSYYLVVNIRFTTDLAERIMFSYNLVEMRYPGMTSVGSWLNLHPITLTPTRGPAQFDTVGRHTHRPPDDSC